MTRLATVTTAATITLAAAVYAVLRVVDEYEAGRGVPG